MLILEENWYEGNNLSSYFKQSNKLNSKSVQKGNNQNENDKHREIESNREKSTESKDFFVTNIKYPILKIKGERKQK